MKKTQLILIIILVYKFSVNVSLGSEKNSHKEHKGTKNTKKDQMFLFVILS